MYTINMTSMFELTKERYGLSYESTLGAEFVEYADGKCIVDLEVKSTHLNIGKSVHGGVIASLLDIALSGAVTCNFLERSESVVTMQMNTNFLYPGFEGDVLRATGEVIKKGSTIWFVEGEIRNQEGRLIAKASGDWFIKPSGGGAQK